MDITDKVGVALWISGLTLIGVNNELKRTSDKLDVFTAAFFFGTFALCTSPFWAFGLSSLSLYYVVSRIM